MVEDTILDRIKQAAEKEWTKLNLSYDNLRELPPEIGQLTSVQSLDLSVNSLTELPPEIGRLTNLQTLDLSYNNLRKLPPEIGQLTNLQSLDLSYNNLRELPLEIGQLTNLQSLNLSDTQLSGLSPEIGQLTNLQLLYLSRNQMSALPSEIGQLTNLQTLYLNNTQLSALPPEIGQLTNLQTLVLSDNQLSALPESIVELRELARFDVRNNPLETPPEEITERGIGAIRDYFRQRREAGVDYLYEAKLLLVGEPGAGKTTLARKIQNPDAPLPGEDETTQGIDIVRWVFPQLDKPDFQVNIWDFGGQAIYHATHRFFLTHRSLYVLVADTRKDDTDFYYWLNIVELLSGNSPVLIIKNEKDDRPREINERQLRGQFTNLKEVLQTNLKTKRGLEEIGTHVQQYISNLPHVGDELPKTWLKVRRELENNPHNYISLDEYLEICKRNGFKKHQDKLQLSTYLHELGICLHYQDDPLLNKTVILKTDWCTAAVYKVLDTNRVIEDLGRFTRADLDEIWGEAEYALMQDELLQMMVKFQLCYRLPESPDTYIVPQLLTENQPVYDWDEADNLLLRYSYEFMPKGILWQFIVVMHGLIAEQQYVVISEAEQSRAEVIEKYGLRRIEIRVSGKNKRDLRTLVTRVRHYVWRSGVILEAEQSRAEVIEKYGVRRIEIRVSGRQKRDLLTRVRHELEKIHKRYPRLQYSELIPCKCDPCRNSQEPHFYEYKTLKDFISRGNKQIMCYKSGDIVNILPLIDDIESGERLFLKDESELEDKDRLKSAAQAGHTIQVNVDLSQDKVEKMTKKVITIGAGAHIEAPVTIADTIENSFNTLRESSVDDDVKQLLAQLLKVVTEVNKQVPQDKADDAEAMARDAEALVKEATSSKPRRRWYEVSVEGLKQAAINIGEIADPVLDIVKKLLPLLLGSAG